jgi:hypothetical protein
MRRLWVRCKGCSKPVVIFQFREESVQFVKLDGSFCKRYVCPHCGFNSEYSGDEVQVDAEAASG